MPGRTIDVRGQAYEIQVYCAGKRFWIAAGEYLGEQLRTQGSTAQKAVMAWRKAAEVHAFWREWGARWLRSSPSYVQPRAVWGPISGSS